MAKKDKKENVEILTNTAETESPNYINWLFAILSFVLPPVGYVLYLVWKTNKVKKSLFCGWASLLGCAFYIILTIILILVL